MLKKRKVKGGILAVVGYILSPLSWWNDLFVNIPLAYAFAIVFALISKKLFLPMMILGYWITNVVGFMMMHHGARDLFSNETKKYTRKELVKDIIISVVYTAIVIVFILKGWIKFPTEYFS